jgi:hypothetical protein
VYGYSLLDAWVFKRIGSRTGLDLNGLQRMIRHWLFKRIRKEVD